MSDSLWEPEAAAQAQLDPEPLQPPAEPGALSVSADDFSALEERILRAVNLLKQERQTRAGAEARVAQSEAQAAQAQAELREQAALVTRMQTELTALKAERDQVRQRVERLLAQLDALEL